MAKKKPSEGHALKYLEAATRAMPNASGRELRREIRRQLREDGYGWGWFIVVIKILLELLPLLFSKPR